MELIVSGTGSPRTKKAAGTRRRRERKDNSMAKKSAPEGKATVPCGGPKPAGMRNPPNGQAKMVGPKAKVGKKGR
jgi:hypothetical protein